jgi:hypothetical protein
MSSSNPLDWFENIFTTVENAITPYEPVIEAAEQAAEVVVPIVAKAAPSIAPEIAVAQGLISEGRAIVAAASPEVLKLASIFSALTTHTAAPQASIITPSTTIATAPIKPVPNPTANPAAAAS